MTQCCLLPLALALFLPLASAQAAPPDLSNLPAYLRTLNHATDPKSLAIRRQIANGPADLARERGEAEKEGMWTHLAQLKRPLPPDDQNAAPLYEKLAELRKQMPLHFPKYAQSFSVRYTYTSEQIAAVQKEYDARQDIFNLLHQATDRPDYTLDFDWSNPFDEPVSQYAAMRENARELRTESFLLAVSRHYSEAIVQQSRGYRVADHVSATSTLLSYLVALAIDSITTSGLKDVLTLAGPNIEVDTEVAQAVTEKAGRFSLGQALRGEVAVADGNFSLLQGGNPAALASLASNNLAQVAHAEETLTPAQKAEYLNLLAAAEADYIHRMCRIIQVTDAGDPATTFIRAKQEEQRGDSGSVVSGIADLFLFFTSTNLSSGALRSAASHQVTLAAAAVLETKAKTGTFPAALPGNFPDPFTNKPLGYRREGPDGFVVYSVGSEGKFDGGQPGKTAPSSESAFRYPAQTIPIPADMLK